MLDVTVKSAKKTFWPIVVGLFVGLLLATPVHALRVNISSQGDSDKIIFSFDSGKLPKYSVRRVGKQEMVISFPASTWDSEAKPGSKDYPGKLVQAIRVTQSGVQLTTKTNAFGFITMPVPGKPQFILQLYRDPIGARWKPRKAKVQPKATPKTAQAAQTAVPSPAPISEQTPKEVQPPAQAVQVQPVQPVKQAPQQVQQATVPSTQGEADLPPESSATGERKPFFSVPYSVRTEVSPPGEGPPVSAIQAPATQGAVSGAPTGVYPPASELRFKAVNKMAEEVKFAELAGSSSGRAPVVGQVVQPAPSAVDGSVGGPVGGVVGGTVQQVESSGQGAAGGVVAPPPESQPVQPQPMQQADGGIAGSVAPPPETQVVAVPQEFSGEGQVGGNVASPPMVVQGSPPPEATPEEAAQVAQAVAPQPEELENIQEQPVEEEVDVAVVPEAEVQPEMEEPAMDNATATAMAREEEIRNQLYEAQSMMFNGALAAALPLYEDLLKQTDVPDDVREETLYAVADIKKQINGDDLEGAFEEISQAFIEAMNSNLRSTKVPRALLNLGLLNLQVGNFPEAKAYFNILQDKYPDDDNIPSISYYWGEYYYKKGDYKKAADQFQYLIQTYPEHMLVKQAAYYLADSLDRTGFIEQAFQIVDYIDKRWPDYYMENSQFLRLAGGIEMKLKKWPQAKNHYFTYYNINPEAEGADVVLARLGDIYIRENEKNAAKQIYQKAVEDFPDAEGGLIAKMRLAEEGIYDDPAMSEMVSVFDRPYNKRPENIYKEIIDNHPDNPLAPIAQLKLAMWYAFNKKYPEALSAAQDFIEKYPDSPLIGRARTLGDSVFALAVPGMVGEERYGRVVRYWETYDFIGKEDTKVDDQTRLNIATSYWKVGQPEKALEIITPFLQKRQMQGISDEALGLAVNIYLDQLAWKEISDLVGMAKANWKLEPSQLRQLDYARAMSLQNLGDANKALPMWAELAKDMSVEPSFRAYAMYYMAKAAMERQDLRKVFVYAQEALALLLHTKGDPEKIKDTVLMSIYATERSGRYNEALKWAKEYDQYIDVDNPEWASTRFKLARIYRKAGAMDEWKQLLSDIIEKKPETLQAQLAKSALETYALEQKAQQYAPVPQ